MAISERIQEALDAAAEKVAEISKRIAVMKQNAATSDITADLQVVADATQALIADVSAAVEAARDDQPSAGA